VHNGYSGDAAKFVAEGCGLGHDNISVLITVTLNVGEYLRL
jgi:hypothetical protein